MVAVGRLRGLDQGHLHDSKARFDLKVGLFGFRTFAAHLFANRHLDMPIRNLAHFFPI